MSRTYVQLGRTGDILTLLPLLRMEPAKPRLLIAREYAPLLEGCSYVEPVIFEGAAHELDRAVASLNGEDWVSTQVNGPVEMVERHTYSKAGQPRAMTTSFVKEQWKVAGKLKQWDECWPLIFDRRSPEREAALCEQSLTGTKNRLVLLSCGGNSSPFPYKDLLLELLRLHSRQSYELLDLATVKAERFYDLLGLYEHAAALIATDSAPLHLAWAVASLPVLVLANDRPALWNGSPWRPNHFWYCRYCDFPVRAVELVRMLDSLKAWKPTQEPRVVHLFNAYQDRLGLDLSNPLWLPFPIWLGSCGRDSHNVLNDPERYPMFRDALRMGLQRTRDQDVLCVTRSDTDFGDDPWKGLLKNSPCFAYRMDQGIYHPVVDLLCASRKFWSQLLPDIPDLVLGKDFWWSDVVRVMFQKHGASDLTGFCHRLHE